MTRLNPSSSSEPAKVIECKEHEKKPRAESNELNIVLYNSSLGLVNCLREKEYAVINLLWEKGSLLFFSFLVQELRF